MKNVEEIRVTLDFSFSFALGMVTNADIGRRRSDV